MSAAQPARQFASAVDDEYDGAARLEQGTLVFMRTPDGDDGEAVAKNRVETFAVGKNGVRAERSGELPGPA